MEELDIFDDELRRIGTAPRERVHAEGLMHHVAHCWIYDERRGVLYFQQRAHDKADFPDYFDTACGGHIDAGEAALPAMLRELREETGLRVTAEQLEFLGIHRPPEFHQPGFHDREFSSVYLLRMENPPFAPGEEVSRMICVEPAQFYEMEVRQAQSIRAFTLDGAEFETAREKWICHDGEFAAVVLPRLRELQKQATQNCCGAFL